MNCPHCHGTGIDPGAQADVQAARDRLLNLPANAHGQYLLARFAVGGSACEHGVLDAIACRPCDLALVDQGTPRRREVRR